MYRLLLIVFIPQITAYVDCKVACYRCRENTEHPLVLEVHCAMCNECQQKRTPGKKVGRDGMELKGARGIEEFHSDNSEECPTPPPCESEEVVMPLKVIRTTTTTTMRTTTKKRCPQVVTCRKKRKKCATPCPTPCAMPCMPICNPCPQQRTQPPHPQDNIQPLSLAATRPTARAQTATDYYYVYVGVPKSLMKS